MGLGYSEPRDVTLPGPIDPEQVYRFPFHYPYYPELFEINQPVLPPLSTAPTSPLSAPSTCGTPAVQNVPKKADTRKPPKKADKCKPCADDGQDREGTEKLATKGKVGGKGAPVWKKDANTSKAANAAIERSPKVEKKKTSDQQPQIQMTGRPEKYVPTARPEVYVPTGRPEVYVPTGRPETYVPTGRPETYVPTGRPETYVPTGRPEMYVPTGSPEMYVPSGGPSSYVPSGGPEMYDPRERLVRYYSRENDSSDSDSDYDDDYEDDDDDDEDDYDDEDDGDDDDDDDDDDVKRRHKKTVRKIIIFAGAPRCPASSVEGRSLSLKRFNRRRLRATPAQMNPYRCPVFTQFYQQRFNGWTQGTTCPASNRFPTYYNSSIVIPNTHLTPVLCPSSNLNLSSGNTRTHSPDTGQKDLVPDADELCETIRGLADILDPDDNKILKEVMQQFTSGSKKI